MEIKKILVPVDFGSTAELTATAASDLAKRYGASVIVLHVLYDMAADAWLYGAHFDSTELYAQMRERARKELDGLVSRFFGGIEAKVEVLLGTPYEDILQYARDEDVDLIVLGSHGKRGLGRVLFGSTAMRVVKNAPCAVHVVRLPKPPNKNAA